jgi:hypothetical protein
MFIRGRQCQRYHYHIKVGIDVAVVPRSEGKTLDIKTNNPSFILNSLTDVLSLV